jgi:O-antigen ligase
VASFRRRSRALAPVLPPLVTALTGIALMSAAVVVVGAEAQPGLGVIALGLGAALVFAGLNSPMLALIIVLFTIFFRLSLKAPALPVELYLFAVAGVVLASAVAVRRRVIAVARPGSVEIVMCCFVAWNLGSVAAQHAYPAIIPGTNASLNPVQFIAISTIVPFVLYYVARTVIDGDAMVRTLLRTFVVFTAYATAMSILPFHAPSLVWPRYILLEPAEQWSERAVGVFVQPVANGLVLVVGFVVAIYLATQQRAAKVERILLIVMAPFIIYAIYLTRTRAVWLAFGLALLLGIVLLPRVRRWFLAITIAVAAFIGLNWATFMSSDRTSGGVGSSTEVNDRLNMIATAFWAIEEKPLFGWGITRFTQVNTYNHRQWAPDVPWIYGYRDSSHDNEVGIAAELGLIGLALWLAVLLLIGWQLWRAFRTLPVDGLSGRGLAAVAIIAFACWIAIGRTVDLRFFDYPNILIMILSGAVVGIAGRRRPPDRPADPEPPVRWRYPGAAAKPALIGGGAE